MRQEFWKMERGVGNDKLAEWAPTVGRETVICPRFADHRRPGRRRGKLSVNVPRSNVDDIVWTWYGDCLITEAVVDALRVEGISGYVTKDADATFAPSSGGNAVRRLWELVPTGWGGVAAPGSGVEFDRARSCSVCGMLVYTGMTCPAALFDRNQWDGSDIFIVWPLPRSLIVSDRMAKLLRSREVTGVTLTHLEDLPPTSPILSPGRLSDWMPSDRALQLGAALGID